MKKLDAILSVVIMHSALMTLIGCVSPLHSSDPATRLQTVEKIVNEDELFFIAMDVGVGLKGKWPEMYAETHLRDGEYSEDVRVAAVKKLSDPARLVKCACWPDGEVYCDPGIERGRFEYCGETYWVNDAERRLQHSVRPGDAVRAAAMEKLGKDVGVRNVISLLASLDANANGGPGKTIRGALFPGKEQYSVGCKENAFVDYYGRVKQGNPLDQMLTKLIGRQENQGLLCAYVAAFNDNAVMVYPSSVEAALLKIDGSDARAVHDAFDALSKSAGAKCRVPPAIWLWRMLKVMENPSEQELMCAARIGYGESRGDKLQERQEIDSIALRRFTGDVWAECYLGDLFAGYPKSQMVRNIKDGNAAARFLIKARKIDLNDVGPAFLTITNAETLVRIEKECFLKVVAEKARLLHFEMTYQAQFDDLGMIDDPIQKAIAATKYKKSLERSGIARQEKKRLSVSLSESMNAGVKRLMEECPSQTAKTFAVQGYYPGMPAEHAKLLYDVVSPNADVKWVAAEDGKTVRIDLGTTYLATAFRYDAETWKEWIACFSRETKRQFKEETLSDEKKPIGGRGTVVRVSQSIWRHQDHRADITVTYFGEKKVEEIEPKSSGLVESVFKIARGLTGGEVVKEVVLEGARHWANEEWDREIGGPAGTLRLEVGSAGPGGSRVISQPRGKTSVDRTADTVKDTYRAVKDTLHAVEGYLK